MVDINQVFGKLTNDYQRPTEKPNAHLDDVTERAWHDARASCGTSPTATPIRHASTRLPMLGSLAKFKTFRHSERALTRGLVATPSQASCTPACWGTEQAQSLDHLLDGQREEAAAQGKVVFLLGATDRPIEILCFQVHEKSAAAAFCGNATAAALATHTAHFGPVSRPVYAVCDESRAEVNSLVRQLDGHWCVDQTWRIAQEFRIEETVISGMRAVRSNILNSYSFLRGPMPKEELPSLLATLIDSPSAKVAMITHTAGIPRVDFFNCNGQHGAAPQTGLATLALLRSRVDWLQEVIKGEVIMTPGGAVALPRIHHDQHGSAMLTMPTVNVSFQSITPKEETHACTIQ